MEKLGELGKVLDGQVKVRRCYWTMTLVGCCGDGVTRSGVRGARLTSHGACDARSRSQSHWSARCASCDGIVGKSDHDAKVRLATPRSCPANGSRTSSRQMGPVWLDDLHDDVVMEIPAGIHQDHRGGDSRAAKQRDSDGRICRFCPQRRETTR